MDDYFHNKDNPKRTQTNQLLEHLLAISKGECDITDEMVLESKDDDYQQILGGMRLLHEDLKLYKEDFTKKMEADHQLEILKKKNEELAQFNYVASHDLQSPLQTITTFTNLMVKNYGQNLDKEGLEYLKFISAATNRMSKLVHSLLMYSCIGRDFKTESIDLNELVSEVLEDLRGIIVEAKPKFIINKLPIINANRISIYQLFSNLMCNAIKFRKEHQPIEITISFSRNESHFEFCIKDNGIGIEPQYTNQIFDVFERLHNEDEYKGTGIGLASCKKIVEVHSGKLWVESEFGVGSKFYFTLAT